ncbi:MAG: hypothetical protein D6748_00570 [Calditrichaeota bacterium]|nr:MAG: hypothetical protein D6748_00570 [Calditrichota bacterium]
MKYIWMTLILFFFLFSSCTNPFSTRIPDEPDLGSDPIGTRSLQTNPDSLLSKIQLAFRNRDPQSYAECLADSLNLGTAFSFKPEKDEAYRFFNWQREDEIIYFTNFVNTQDLLTLNITYSEVNPWTTISATTQDTLQTSFSYQILAKFRTKSEYYQGRTILRIFKSSAELWYIYQWEDFKLRSAATDSTWSTLKANYRY